MAATAVARWWGSLRRGGPALAWAYLVGSMLVATALVMLFAGDAALVWEPEPVVPTSYVHRSLRPLSPLFSVYATDAILDHRPDHERSVMVFTLGVGSNFSNPMCLFSSGDMVKAIVSANRDTMARARYLACPLGELVARDIESAGDKSRQVGPYDLIPYLSNVTVLMDYDHHLALPVLNVDLVPYYPPPTTPPWYTTVCVRIWRSEEVFATPQWIEYNLMMGVEHFFIYVSRLSVEEVHEALRLYVDQEIVTLVRWELPGFPDDPLPQHQVGAINHCLHRFAKPTSTWTLMIDVDEYLFPGNPNDTFVSILQRQDPTLAAIEVQHFLFTRSLSPDGNRTGLFMDYYYERTREHYPKGKKLITRNDRALLWNVHRLSDWAAGSAPLLIPAVELRMNHYVIYDRADRVAEHGLATVEDRSASVRYSHAVQHRLALRSAPPATSSSATNTSSS